MKNIPIISVTGTKGKTTTVTIISDVLKRLGCNVLTVDTTGHFINGQRKSTLEDSKNVWGLVPSVCPGRYLWEFHLNKQLCKNGVAVLECALGSSALSGLGYRYHDIGVFLNVFEDHIGSSDRLKSKSDIAEAKSFIFSRLRKEGSYAIFNADDPYVVNALQGISKSAKNTLLVPIGLKFDNFDINNHLSCGGVAISMNTNKQIIIKYRYKDEIIADLKSIPWTFSGCFEPSVYNTMSSIGALYAYYNGKLPNNIRQSIEKVRLDPYGGRLTLLKNNKDVKIIADYAHEKISLSQVAKLARSQVSKGGQIIGVVRLAHDRTDELMIDTGKTIALKFNKFVVYDKIDGYYRKPKNRISKFKEIKGRTSKIFNDAIKSVNSNTIRIIREDNAIKRAAEIAKPGDVVVVIVNDNIKRSIEFIKKYFKAEFV